MKSILGKNEKVLRAKKKSILGISEKYSGQKWKVSWAKVKSIASKHEKYSEQKWKWFWAKVKSILGKREKYLRVLWAAPLSETSGSVQARQGLDLGVNHLLSYKAMLKWKVLWAKMKSIVDNSEKWDKSVQA